MISTPIVTRTMTAGRSRPRIFVSAGAAGGVVVSVAVGAVSTVAVLSVEVELAVVVVSSGETVLAVSVVATAGGALLLAESIAGDVVVPETGLLVVATDGCAVLAADAVDLRTIGGSGVAAASFLLAVTAVRGVVVARLVFAVVPDVDAPAVRGRADGLLVRRVAAAELACDVDDDCVVREEEVVARPSAGTRPVDDERVDAPASVDRRVDGGVAEPPAFRGELLPASAICGRRVALPVVGIAAARTPRRDARSAAMRPRNARVSLVG